MWVLWQPLGAKGLLRSDLPRLCASGPASQASPVSSSSPPVPTEQHTRRTESKEAPGTPLIVHALGGSLASQHEEGPQSQGCPTATHSALAKRLWGRYICFEALHIWGRPYGTAGNCEFLCFQHGQCKCYRRGHILNCSNDPYDVFWISFSASLTGFKVVWLCCDLGLSKLQIGLRRVHTTNALLNVFVLKWCLFLIDVSVQVLCRKTGNKIFSNLRSLNHTEHLNVIKYTRHEWELPRNIIQST